MNTRPGIGERAQARALRWLVLPCAVSAAVWSGSGAVFAAEPEAATAAIASGPRFVALEGEIGTLVAGEAGALDLAVRVLEPAAARWDASGEPAFVRVSADADSGIRFDGAQPGGEAVVTLDPGAAVDGVVAARVPYTLSSRVRVKPYALRFDLSVPLIAADGARIRDAGTVRMPVKVDTPLRTKLIVLGVLALAVFLFVVEWVRVDVVAIMMMVSMPMLNLLSSKDTFTGLSSNAVIAIIGVMIISAGLNKVGLVSRAVKPVIRAAGKSPQRLMVSLSSLIAVFSSVMQNTGAAVLFLPGIRHACKVMKLPISRVLMPIGMCAILGGTLTMIGTSPLILLNDILPEGVEKFGLLELTPIGLGFVVCGLLYFSTVGMFFLRKISDAQQERQAGFGGEAAESDVRAFYHDLAGPFELRIPTKWEPPAGGPRTVVGVRRERHVNIVCLSDRRGIIEEAPNPEVELSGGLSLCVYGPEDGVRKFAAEYGIHIRERPVRFREITNPAVAGTVEAVVSPRSSLVGQTIRDIGFRATYDVTVLALYREGRTYYREMGDIPLLPGDALLLHSTWEHFHTLQEAHDHFKIITPLEVEIQKPSKSGPAVLVFLIALTMMMVSSFYFAKLPYNPIPLGVCLMTGALLMVLTGVLQIRDAYRAVDWRTVFLLGGLIPLGMAVDRTGTAEWIATGVVAGLGDAVTPFLLLAVLAVLSGVFCLVISNVGACTLLVPLGASMANQIDIDPRVAAIVVGLGVSNSFLLPTHQVNALYMGPGGYRTKDYMKVGGAMSVIYIVVLVLMTYFFYL